MIVTIDAMISCRATSARDRRVAATLFFIP
jgi:hypothetical protein